MDNPKLFVSYSWSSYEHEQRVMGLATELVESGINVVLDKWDLLEGQNVYAFMEKMVADPEISKVVMICDKLYAEKADGRSGGVGTETEIISREVYEKADQNKFVAVVVEKDEEGKPYLPTYYKSRKYVDLSDEDQYAKNFEQLLRWIYDKPLYVKPEIGKRPAFLSEENSIALGTGFKFKRALDATKNNKGIASGAVTEYFESLSSGLEKFRVSETEGNFDDEVIEKIGQFLPYRNEALEIFLGIAQYSNTPEFHRQIHRFLEQLIPYLGPPHGVSHWTDRDFDNFKFLIAELFLYIIASFLKHGRFDAVAYLLRQGYYQEREAEYGRDVMKSFNVFSHPVLASLKHRNDRLRLSRLSLHADLLIERVAGTGFTQAQIMQADFVLFLRDSLDALSKGEGQKWWPDTLLYKASHSGPFEIFARARSVKYFNEFKCILDIIDKQELIPLMEAFESGKLRVPKWQYETIHPRPLVGFDRLATSP